MPLDIEFSADDLPPAEAARIRQAVAAIAADAVVAQGEVSITLVRDAAMHQLNRQYLDHDYTTDVLSFVLEREDDRLIGEIIANLDYAERESARYGWRPEDELLLYIIHGMLHLVGHDDLDEAGRAKMRHAEAAYLAPFGLSPPWDED